MKRCVYGGWLKVEPIPTRHFLRVARGARYSSPSVSLDHVTASRLSIGSLDWLHIGAIDRIAVSFSLNGSSSERHVRPSPSVHARRPSWNMRVAPDCAWWVA